MIVFLAGCGASPLETRTDPLASGTLVEPQVYLNDAAGVANAMRDFQDTLAQAGPSLSIAEAKRLAPQLQRHARDARAIHTRLSHQRLDDARLEEQRQRVVPPLGQACTAMEQAANLAAAGQVKAVLTLLKDLPGLLDEVRAAAA